MLTGITVLEAPGGIATAYCGRLLADLGARVIAVEPPGGAPLRAEGPYPDGRPNGAYGGLFAYLNGGKESVTLNLASEDGSRLLEQLAGQVDVLVEEVSGAAVDDVRPRYERLRRGNSALLMTSITPFGLSGPRRCWLATPLTLFAMSSRMRVHGKPDRHPLQYAPDTVPFQAGATAAAATATALAGRIDAGRLIEVPVLEALIANVDALTILTSFTGLLSKRGLYTPLMYPCGDGFMILSFQDRAISGMIAAMGQPELANDPRFANRHAVAAHQDEFDAYLLPWLLDHTREELFEVLQANHVMCAPMMDLVEVLGDKHYSARGFFRSVDDPELGRITLPGSAFPTECRPGPGAPAVLAGSHNDRVYGEMLGLDHPTMMRLRGARVI